MKMRARMAGFMEAGDWTKEMEAHRKLLEQEASRPLPIDMITAYVKELNEREKQAVARTLDFPFAKRDMRKWPEMLFVKMMNGCIQQACKDIAMKRKLLLAILLQTHSLTEHEDESLSSLADNRDELIAKYGYWPFYWNVYFHPGKNDDAELWSAVLKQLNERKLYGAIGDKPRLEVAPPPLSAVSPDTGKLDKKIQLLESLYAKETDLRQRLEQEVAQKDKQLRTKAQELERMGHALEQFRRDFEHANNKDRLAERERQDLEYKRKQEQELWLAERQSLMNSLRDAANKQRQLEQAMEAQSKEMAQHQKDKSQLRHTIADLKRLQDEPDTLIQRLSHTLYAEIDQLNGSLLQDATNTGEAITDRLSVRRRIRSALDVADALDEYSLARQPKPGHDSNIADATAAPAEQAPLSEPPVEAGGKADQPQLFGTFYRRDHGGYIVLENGETFNITESLVYQHELQHEAGVLCTPGKGAEKPFYYELELLFQGDDANSPIAQFDGYVELGEAFTWYCVDLNDAANRYPIHHKDVEIQKPSQGDPCTFNVADGSHIARLTKLYRVHGAGSAAPDEKKPHPAELDDSRKKNSRDKAAAKTKPEPFLQGSVITIIGGLRKWFEDVVLECGADLVHESGDHPDRVAAALRRSQALFLLLTSTSHRATWEGIEIAKAHSIPHFTIQGSKSNLRALLWDNRELIAASNR